MHLNCKYYHHTSGLSLSSNVSSLCVNSSWISLLTSFISSFLSLDCLVVFSLPAVGPVLFLRTGAGSGAGLSLAMAGDCLAVSLAVRDLTVTMEPGSDPSQQFLCHLSQDRAVTGHRSLVHHHTRVTCYDVHHRYLTT